MRNGNYTISIVVPAYNEEQNIPILYKALVAVLKNYQHYEIIKHDQKTPGLLSPGMNGHQLWREVKP